MEVIIAAPDELMRRHLAGGLSFARAKAFNLDEYVGLPADHPERYRNVIEHEIVAAGGVDLQILGIGTDGQVAFNEPGSSLASRRTACVDERRQSPSITSGGRLPDVGVVQPLPAEHRGFLPVRGRLVLRDHRQLVPRGEPAPARSGRRIGRHRLGCGLAGLLGGRVTADHVQSPLTSRKEYIQ